MDKALPNTSASASHVGPVQVLFVCLGNICRSPTAHGVFERLISSHELDKHIAVDSAGTGDWHIGHPPDPRSQEAAQKRGYQLTHLRSRQITPEDFDRFHYILAMDHSNLTHLRAMQPQHYQGVLELFLAYARDHAHLDEVPDPYGGGEQGFERVLDMVEDAAEGLLAHLRAHHF